VRHGGSARIACGLDLKGNLIFTHFFFKLLSEFITPTEVILFYIYLIILESFKQAEKM
jgi:hypothetical protein